MKEPRILKFEETADGEKITRFEDGSTFIEKADGTKLWTDEHGKVIRGLTPGGESFEVSKHVPPEMRPLNVYSKSSEEIGRLLSNFAETPFVLDGIKYASVEGFYAALKYWQTPEEIPRVAGLWGGGAKKASSKRKPDVIEYGGESFAAGSSEHHALIKRAIRAKLEHNQDIAEQFRRTKPRPIVHDTGRPDNRKTRFPATVFVRILTELRDEL